jgi:hypothetical protein
MSTWSALLTDIRADLKDSGTTLKYSDSMIFLYLKDALRDYSQFFPLKKFRVAMVLNLIPTSFVLPLDYIGGAIVECPLDRFLEERLAISGNTYNSVRPATTFAIVGGLLYINGDPPTSSVYLSYDAHHPIPAAITGPPAVPIGDFVMTIPEDDEELIRLYIKAKVYGQTRTLASSLDRFKLGTGARDDNPLRPEVSNLMDEYHAKIDERFPGGVVKLYRPGKYR